MPVTPAAPEFISNATTSSKEAIPGLAFPVSANRLYFYEAFIPVTVAATTTGLGFSVDVPGSPTFNTNRARIPSSATVGTDSDTTDATATDDDIMQAADTAVAAGTLCSVEGYCRPSA